MACYRERLGPRIKIGPIGLGSRLGEKVEPGREIFFNSGSDTYGDYGYSAMVLRDDQNPQVGIDCHYEHCGIPIRCFKQLLPGKSVNRSEAKKVIRWAKK